MAEIQVAVFTDAGTRDHNEDAADTARRTGEPASWWQTAWVAMIREKWRHTLQWITSWNIFRKWNVVQKKAFLRFLKGRIRQCGNVRKSVRICGRQWRPHSLKMADSGTFMREIPGAII